MMKSKEGADMQGDRIDFTVSEVAYAFYKKCRQPYALKVTERPYDGLTLVLAGCLKMQTESGGAVAHEGNILLQRAGDSYLLTDIGDRPAEYIVISYHATPADVLYGCLPQSRVFCPSRVHRYRDAFVTAADIYGSHSVCAAPMVRAVVQELLCDIVRWSFPRALSSAENPAAAARYYIDEYYDRHLTAAAIADVAGCSQSHLRALFHAAYGLSPMQYLNTVRVDKAKEMLSCGLFRLDEIADACGFANEYYFSRVFKQYTGVSPGKY